ncbi:MAG: ATP-dependent Clp protease ATP-binding subunit [Candidatus Pacebacteria bacterium]|nr:ATP-dependent Clp protease ATP-binding subunit [Candidatus Paceibacterota bacterium]
MALEFYFNPTGTAIMRAVKWQRKLVFRLAKPLKIIFFIFSLLSSAAFIYFYFAGKIFGKPPESLLGLSVVFIAVAIGFTVTELFFDFKIKNPKLKIPAENVFSQSGTINLAEYLSFDAAKTVAEAVKFAKSKPLPEVSSTALFYSLLSENPKLNFIFFRAILEPKNIKKTLEDYFKILKAEEFTEAYSHNFYETIFGALEISAKKNHKRIEVGDMLASLAKNDQIFNKILIDSNLKVEDVDNLVRWEESLEVKINEEKEFWEYKNLVKKGNLAKEWTSGYTVVLDQFSIDWTEFIRKHGFSEIVGHNEALEQVERILSRNEINNVLLIGEPGSGRGSILQALAQKCILGESLPGLNYKRVVELDLTSLLSQVEDLERVEMILDKIFQEVVTAGNIILIINEFHSYIGQLVRPGIIDISGILASYLKSPLFRIIAVTSYSGLHENIEQNSSILSFFEKVEISEISTEETILLLENMSLALENRYKKFVTYPAIKDLVFYADKYLKNVSFPKKAIDLLDETMIYVSQSTKDQLVLPRHVANIISEKTQIPIGELKQKEKEILLNLEELIHQRIINQEEAVSEISSALRRTRADITIRRGPMGVFLFLGPTGVGKTETAKALSEIYFGSEEKMIRLDMSEFQTTADIQRLLGTTGKEGLLSTKVAENPFSLILLDEIEKAHPDILNLFLQVFDEGNLTDGMGRRIDFKNSLIICTSNAGYQIILDALKETKPLSEIKDELLDFLFKEGKFRPEFINRFDGVIIFRSLTKENLLEISELLLNKLKENLKEKGIEFKITQDLKEKIVELSFNPVFGAREMRRVIQDKIENVLSFSLLSGKIKRGDIIEINSNDFKIKIN